MDGTKIYTIKINGVDQSIKSVQELYKVLNTLQDQVVDLKINKVDTGNLENRIKAIRRSLELGNFSYIKEPLQEVSKEIDKLNQKAKNTKLDKNLRVKAELLNVDKVQAQIKDVQAKTSKPFNVRINGVMKGFDKLPTAIRALKNELNRLSLEGKQNTVAFKQIQSQLIQYQNTVNKTNRVVKQMTGAPITKFVKQVQGLTALSSVGTGLQMLFGGKSQALDEAIQKFTALSLIMQGLSEVEKQLANETSLLSKAFNVIPNTLKGLTSSIEQAISTKLRKATFNWVDDETFNQFKEGIKEYERLIEPLRPIGAEDLLDLKGLQQMADVFDNLQETIQGTKNRIALNKRLGVDTSQDVKELGELQNALWLLEDSWKDLSQNPEKLTKEIETNFSGAYKSLSIFQKGLLGIKNILNTLSQSKAFKYISGLASTALGFAAISGVLQALSPILEKLSNLFQNIIDSFVGFIDISYKFSKQNKAIVEEIKAINDAYNELQGNISKDDTNKKLQNTLWLLQQINKNIPKQPIYGGEQYVYTPYGQFSPTPSAGYNKTPEKDFFEQARNLALKIDYSSVDQAKKTVKDYIDYVSSNENALRIQKATKILGEDFGNAFIDMDKAIKQAWKDIQTTYEDVEKENKDRQRRIADNNVAAIKDENKRRLAEIENNRKKEIEDAKGNKEEIASINAKYDVQRQTELKQQGDKLRSIQRQIEQNLLETMKDGLAKQLAELNLQRKQELDSAENNGKLRASINAKYDKKISDAKKNFYKQQIELLEDYEEQMRQINNAIIEQSIPDYENNLGRSKDYYKDLYNDMKQYHDKVKDIAKENIEAEYDYKEQDEIKSFKDRLKNLNDNLDKGLLTREKYNDLVEEFTKAHNDTMIYLNKQREEAILKSNAEYYKKDQDNYNTYLEDRINKASTIDTVEYSDLRASRTGFTSSSGRTIKEIKASSQSIIDKKGDLQYTKAQVESALDEGLINSEQYRERIKQIEDADKNLSIELDKNTKEQKEILQERAELFMNYANQILDSAVELTNNLIQNELDKDAKQQEIAEGEIEQLEENYGKQEDITNDHLSKMNDIEEELAESRGDRRARLIEQLNAEREAYLASLEAQEELQDSKEKTEKRLERLQQKQQRLEKKQKRAQQVSNIATTIMNTATAVMQAYKDFPFPYSTVVAGILGAIGAANVAVIASQKFAKGGIIEGNSHQNGGVQVEAEGGEYIINKATVRKNRPFIEYLNKQNKELSLNDLIGGNLPIYNDLERPVVVSVVDINNAQQRVRNIQVLSGSLE